VWVLNDVAFASTYTFSGEGTFNSCGIATSAYLDYYNAHRHQHDIFDTSGTATFNVGGTNNNRVFIVKPVDPSDFTGAQQIDLRLTSGETFSDPVASLALSGTSVIRSNGCCQSLTSGDLVGAPEPASLALFGLRLVRIGANRRRWAVAA
jgi:hypothetical protein